MDFDDEEASIVMLAARRLTKILGDKSYYAQVIGKSPPPLFLILWFSRLDGLLMVVNALV